jgi:O-antigen/teichoic acid export membrane protein
MSVPEEPVPRPIGDGGQFNRPGRRVTLSILSGGANTVLVAGLGALAIRLITVHVGPTNYGLFVTSLAFVSSVMLLTDLGINSITGREIARSPNDAAEILGHNLGLRLTLSAIFVPILAFVGIALYHEPSLRWSIVLIALAVPFDALRAISLGYYAASIRNYVASGITLLQQVLFVAGVAIALTSGFGIVGCATSYLVSTFVSGSLAFLIVRREVLFKPLFNLKRWRQIFALSASLGAIQAINILYLKADTLILSRMSTPHAVGLYGVAYSFTTFILVVPSLIMMSVMPLLATTSGEQFAELVRRALHGLAVLGTAAVIIVLLFAPQAIMVLSGRHFLGAATPMRLLALASLLSYLNAALGWAAVACNHHHRMILVSGIGLILNVGLNLVLIPRFGIDGAATSTLISEFVALIGVRVVFGRDVGAKISLTKISFLPVLIGIIVVLFGRYVFLGSWHAPVSTILWAPGFLILYLGLLALVGGLPEEVVFARKKISSVTHRRITRR